MRTKHEKVGVEDCPYCNNGHDPAIECRYIPQDVNGGGELRDPKPPQPRKPPTRVFDASGKLIAVYGVK